MESKTHPPEGGKSISGPLGSYDPYGPGKDNVIPKGHESGGGGKSSAKESK